MKSPNILLSIVAAVTMTFGLSTSSVQGGAGGTCASDITSDGQINGPDLAQLLADWGSCPGPCASDIIGDGEINGADLAQLLADWGQCPAVVPAWATLLEAAPNPAVVTDANLRAAIVASGFAWRIKDTSSNIEMLLIPEGTFTMGCSPGDTYCGTDESPTHQVTLTNAFYMGKTEVTQAQWQAKMMSNPSYFVAANGFPENFDRPVDSVTWSTIASGSNSFMSLTGLRLPTEAEWEYACRAATTPALYGVLDDIAWYQSNSVSQTHAVAGKLPNALGLYDTLGNVSEWCQDWYGPYESGSVTNPTGPATGSNLLVRGGSWGSGSVYCRGSQRYYYNPNYADGNLGFRAVRNP